MEKVLRKFTLDFFAKSKHKTTPDEFFNIEDGVLIDVRSKEEADSLSIKMTCYSNIIYINIPINELPDKLDDIPKEKPIAIFCSSGYRAAIAYVYLYSKGFSLVRILDGGYDALIDAFKPSKVLKALKMNNK